MIERLQLQIRLKMWPVYETTHALRGIFVQFHTTHNRAITASKSDGNVAGMYGAQKRCAWLSDFLSGCPNQETGRTFLFKSHKIGACS
jgi:hypothetical protein